jgi:hypothetical protein
LDVPAWGITLARIDATGMLIDCPALPQDSIERQVDLQPPLFDTADQVPLTLFFPAPENEEVEDLPLMKLQVLDPVVTELCRDLSVQ